MSRYQIENVFLRKIKSGTYTVEVPRQASRGRLTDSLLGSNQVKVMLDYLRDRLINGHNANTDQLGN